MSGSTTQGWVAPGKDLGLYSPFSTKPQKAFKQGHGLGLFLEILFWLTGKEEIGKGGIEAQRPPKKPRHMSRPGRNSKVIMCIVLGLGVQCRICLSLCDFQQVTLCL